jgi:hypothetical protein
MPFKKFDEYFNSKGSLVTKPKVVPVADYDGPDGSKPLSAVTKDLGMSIPKSVGEVNPYVVKTKAVVPPGNKGGLAYDGKKVTKLPDGTGKEGTVVKNQWPNKKSNQKSAKIAAKSGVKTWPRTKTEEFIDKTKDMSISEFTQYMLKECGCQSGMDEDGGGDDALPMVTAYTTGKFHPHPPEAIKYVVALAKANPRVMDSLIHEMKRAGALDGMLGSTLDHPESFDHLTDLLGDDEEGPRRSKNLVRSMDDKFSKFQEEQEGMYESVAPPYGIHDDDDEEGDQSPHPTDPAIDGGDEEGMDSPDVGGDDEELPDDDEMGPEGDLPDPGATGEEGLDGEDGEEPEGPPEQDGTPPAPPEDQPRRLKKKFPHDHLIDAMGEYDHMRDKMKRYA